MQTALQIGANPPTKSVLFDELPRNLLKDSAVVVQFGGHRAGLILQHLPLIYTAFPGECREFTRLCRGTMMNSGAARRMVNLVRNLFGT